jgi:hypothetical protein
VRAYLGSLAMSRLLLIPATVDVAGIELGTIGVVLLILASIGGCFLSLCALWVAFLLIGSRRSASV